MDNKSVFKYRDYKDYLLARTGKAGTRTGFRSRLAVSAGCNTAYVSQVLNGGAHFSIEQAERLSDPLDHTEDEAHFFLLLVQLARAGTSPLKKYFESQVDKILDQRLNIQKRLGVKRDLSPADQAVYYSAWHYAAIHVALTIPQLNQAEALSKYFDIPLKKVRRVLEFFVSTGLASEKGGRYFPGEIYIHLSQDSENILRHHTNWRLQAINSIARDATEDVHYAAAVTLSRKDAFKVKDLIIENLKNMNKLISDSKEEEVYCFTTDFFHLAK